MPYDRKSRRNYSTLPKYPYRRVERRLKTPPIIKRPLRFQTRSLINKAFLRPNDWKFILHRRGTPGRPWVGENPLEARAVPDSEVRGTLPERIIYKYLRDVLKLSPEVDFEFQSSLQGGRLDTGGIVADFLFPYLMIVLNPLGPTHDSHWRMRKDDEQTMALADLGYTVYTISEDDVYNEQTLERWMRQIFGWVHGGGMDEISTQLTADEPEQDPLLLIWTLTIIAEQKAEEYYDKSG